MIKIIDKQLLDDVSRLAQKSVRLRMNYNFHQSLEISAIVSSMLLSQEQKFQYTGIRQKMSHLWYFVGRFEFLHIMMMAQ